MHRVRILCFLALLFVPNGAWAQGQPLGPEFRVNTYTVVNQNRPAVASDSTGKFVVVWQSSSQDGSSYGVFGQRYASTGAPLGPEFRVNTYPSNSQHNPVVTSDSSGNFVVVWVSYTQDGAGAGVFGQRFASTGEPLGPEFRVNTFTTDSQGLPAVASDSSGNFVVAWQSGQYQDPGSTDVFGQRYASTGEPLGPEFRVNTYTTNYQGHPAVASDLSGNFVVIWPTLRASTGSSLDSSFDVFGQVFASSGAPLGPEFRVNTYTTNSQRFPAVASDFSGNFIVAWASRDQDGSDYGVFRQRCCSSTGALAHESRVNTYTTNRQSFPALASDSSGDFVVVWMSYSQDGRSYGVFARRYDTTGAPLAPEFRVNTYTLLFQNRPSVASDASGNFVVVWESFNQDGSGYGVFGQRFSAIAAPE